MNVDRILAAFNEAGVDYLLIGGMNYLLRHAPVSTFDVDFWIEPSAENCRRCEAALSALDASWGPSEAEWRPVKERNAGWLGGQSVYCLSSPHGAIDIFLAVSGLPNWRECAARAVAGVTGGGVPYRGLCDRDMLASQEALAPADRKGERIHRLRQAIEGRGP